MFLVLWQERRRALSNCPTPLPLERPASSIFSLLYTIKRKKERQTDRRPSVSVALKRYSTLWPAGGRRKIQLLKQKKSMSKASGLAILLVPHLHLHFHLALPASIKLALHVDPHTKSVTECPFLCALLRCHAPARLEFCNDEEYHLRPSLRRRRGRVLCSHTLLPVVVPGLRRMRMRMQLQTRSASYRLWECVRLSASFSTSMPPLFLHRPGGSKQTSAFAVHALCSPKPIPLHLFFTLLWIAFFEKGSFGGMDGTLRQS